MIKIEEYFRESNLIEGVTSGRALKQSLDAWNYLSSLEWLNTNRIETAHGFLMEGFMTYGAGLIRTADVVVGGRLCPQAHKVLALLMVWCDEWAQDRLPKDQADMKMFNPSNAFDAEGLTRLTEEIETRKKKRSDAMIIRRRRKG